MLTYQAPQSIMAYNISSARSWGLAGCRSGSYFVKEILINCNFKLKIQITYICPLWYDVGDLHLLHGK